MKVHVQTPCRCKGDSGVDARTFYPCARHFPCDAGSWPELELELPCPRGRLLQKPLGAVRTGLQPPRPCWGFAGVRARLGLPLLWGPSQEPPCPGLSLADLVSHTAFLLGPRGFDRAQTGQGHCHITVCSGVAPCGKWGGL